VQSALQRTQQKNKGHVMQKAIMSHGTQLKNGLTMSGQLPYSG
jgi:hypothetical protein